MNDAIKNAILKYVEKNNLFGGEDINESIENLLLDASHMKSLRTDLNKCILDLKIQIIKTNTMLLFENVFKDNNEKVVEILNNTKDPKIFYDLSDSLNNLLITFNQYKSNYNFNSTDLKNLKESFVLDDDKLVELIKEINLDKKNI
tara:strand:+ start:1759 stop:2196 length:438 start_codon:yes stop_codon:yes gene_type:complete